MTSATTATHRFVETGGIRMHIAEQGSGPTVLLLHGFPECWYSWRHQLAALGTEGFHAVAPDQRGYARSAAPDAASDYTLLHGLRPLDGPRVVRSIGTIRRALIHLTGAD